MADIGAIQKGLTLFIDNEVAPKLSGMTRILVAGAGGILASKLDTIIRGSRTSSALGNLMIIDESGDIDIDTVYGQFKRAIGQAGQVSIDIPIPFQTPLTMTFREGDLDKLYEYIRQAGG